MANTCVGLQKINHC